MLRQIIEDEIAYLASRPRGGHTDGVLNWLHVETTPPPEAEIGLAYHATHGTGSVDARLHIGSLAGNQQDWRGDSAISWAVITEAGSWLFDEGIHLVDISWALRMLATTDVVARSVARPLLKLVR